jgi:hypothetical protein
MGSFFASTQPQSEAEAAAAGLRLSPAPAAGIRLFRDPVGKIYVLVAAKSLDGPTNVILKARTPSRFREIAPGGTLAQTGPTECTIRLAAGDGACLEVLPAL